MWQIVSCFYFFFTVSFLFTKKVLDGLQYLHWRGCCHLDIQPDNVVIASVRSVQIKLVDMGSVQRVTKLGNVVKHNSSIEYTGNMFVFVISSY